jgi:hypothetical protein
MELSDRKEDWYDKLYAVERNIGEVNSTLLLLSLILIRESVTYMKSLKDKII